MMYIEVFLNFMARVAKYNNLIAKGWVYKVVQ